MPGSKQWSGTACSGKNSDTGRAVGRRASSKRTCRTGADTYGRQVAESSAGGDVPGVVCFDALRVKLHVDGGASKQGGNLALGVQAGGQHDVLGLWVEQTDGHSSGSRSSTNSRPVASGTY